MSDVTPPLPGFPPGSPQPDPDPPREPFVPPARFRVHLTVQHQPRNGQATEPVPHADGSFTRLIDSDEECWRRTMTVGEEWVRVDFGWTAEDGRTPAHVTLVNREAETYQRIPTPEQRAADMAKVVEIGIMWTKQGDDVVVPFAVLPVVEAQPWTPLEGAAYYMRCRDGKAKVTVAAIPGGPAGRPPAREG